jgi:Flp pilus assembly protein TadD
MSLLNDALRKKRGERQPIERPLATPPPHPGTKDSNARRKPVRIAIACVLALASVSCGAWLYWQASDKNSSPFMAAAATRADEETSAEPMGNSTVAAGADTAPLQPPPGSAPEKGATPETPAPPRQGAPKKEAPAAKPPAVKSKSSPTVRAERRPEKPKAAIKPHSKKTRPPQSKRGRRSAVKPDNTQRKLQSERLYQKARQYHRRNRLEQAIALYQEVIKADPEHYKARFNLGAAFLETQSFDNAYYIMADLYRKEPGNQQVMLNLALANIGRRRFDQALALLDQAAEAPEPPQFEIALHKGIVFNHLNRTQEALDWYKRAEALRPDDPRLLFNLAVVSDQQQRYAAAIGYYRRHIDQSPGMNAAKEKQIRRRIRALQAYHAQQNPEESISR